MLPNVPLCLCLLDPKIFKCHPKVGESERARARERVRAGGQTVDPSAAQVAFSFWSCKSDHNPVKMTHVFPELGC